jgi:KDO2-lipid IV(A) lauroyltransferase
MKMSHGVEFVAFWTLTKVVQLIPGWLADKIAAGLGSFGFYFMGKRRRITIDNLKRAFKDEKDDKEINRIAKKAFKNVAREVIEFSRAPIVKSKLDSYVVEHTGMEYVINISKYGRGGVLMTGHIGNGEYLGGWLAMKGFPIDFLVGQQHNKLVDNMFNDFRRTFGVGIIPVGISARHVIKTLRSNRMIAMMSDQHSPRGAIVVNFFDRPAATPKGPAAFAVKMKCPLIFGVLIRKKYNQFVALINPPIYPDENEDPEKEIQRLTQEYTTQLEQFIRQYPEQWMWTHRRWKLD